MHNSVKITIASLESDSFGNIFQVRMPVWEAKKRLEMLDKKGVEVTNRKEVETYIKKGEANA
jgi:hypothetical protein